MDKRTTGSARERELEGFLERALMLLRRAVSARLISDEEGALVECGECGTRSRVHPEWCFVGNADDLIGSVNRVLTKGRG